MRLGVELNKFVGVTINHKNHLLSQKQKLLQHHGQFLKIQSPKPKSLDKIQQAFKHQNQPIKPIDTPRARVVTCNFRKSKGQSVKEHSSSTPRAGCFFLAYLSFSTLSKRTT